MDELQHLGASNIKAGYKAVRFEADTATAYGLHLRLRTASRLLWILEEFPIFNADNLQKQASRLPWDQWIPEDATYAIEGVPAERGKGVLGATEISKCVRLGLTKVFQEKVGVIPKVDVRDPEIQLVAYVRQRFCTISIDSTRHLLHMRGYRIEGHPSPIRETLAASILKLAGYDGTQTLADPMCGSGTFPIEAALEAKGIGSTRNLSTPPLAYVPGFDQAIWDSVRKEVFAKKESKAASIYASDIDSAFVSLARKSAAKAGVENMIQFKTMDFFGSSAPEPKGLLIANLPYGERLEAETDLVKFYQDIGDTLKHGWKGWRAALLAGREAPYKFIGLKPSRKIDLLNGSIPVKLLIFDLYEGTRRGKGSDSTPQE